MSDDRPEPRYGEYAPGYVPGSTPPASAPPGSTPPVPAPGAWTPGSAPGPATAPPRRRRTGDLVATVILLGLGLMGMLVGVLFGVALSDTALISHAFQQQGFGTFAGHPGSAPLVIIVSHLALYLVALGLSIAALVRRRLAFWIPLVAGVVAAVVFWVSYISVIASDPTFLQRMGG